MKSKLILILAIVAVTLTACTLAEQGTVPASTAGVNKEEAPSAPLASHTTAPSTSTSSSANSSSSAEPTLGPYTAPLTGLPSDRELTERPVTVMINNFYKARPQSGLHQADIIYEILAEGDITRLEAVFQSHAPKVIGPVRSIRPYYVDIAKGFDSIIVHAGWSQAAMNIIAKDRLAHFDEVYGDGAYYWRDKSRKPPHNLYTSMELIRKGSDKKGFDSTWNGPVIPFAGANDVIEGKPVEKITLNYLQDYTVSYQYSANTATYKRYIGDKPHTDLQTGEQLSGSNILVLFAKHKILDNAGRRFVDVYGPGKGYILQKGKLQEIEWKRSGGMIRAYRDGQEIKWVPGQTWINILPLDAKVTFR